MVHGWAYTLSRRVMNAASGWESRRKALTWFNNNNNGVHQSPTQKTLSFSFSKFSFFFPKMFSRARKSHAPSRNGASTTANQKWCYIKSMFYKEYYMIVWRYEFYLRVLVIFLTSGGSKRVRYINNAKKKLLSVFTYR